MANPHDPRVRRTRAQLHHAARQLLEHDAPLTFAGVAQVAQVNRSTVHQHYADLHDLVADAITEDLRAVAEPLGRCPFDAPDGPPPELVQLFESFANHATAFSRLTPAASALMTQRLRSVLAELLEQRFAAGARPPGWDHVPATVHAHYIAGGLTALLSLDHGAERASAAAQGWKLLLGARNFRGTDEHHERATR